MYKLIANLIFKFKLLCTNTTISTPDQGNFFFTSIPKGSFQES